jgi:hypothetical protein
MLKRRCAKSILLFTKACFAALLFFSSVVYAGDGDSAVYQVSYDEKENLDFSLAGVPVPVGEGKITGSFAAEYVETDEVCDYFRLIASNVKGKISGATVASIPDFKTPWCLYTGIAIECPVTSYGFSYSIPGFFDTVAQIQLALKLSAADAFKPTVIVSWYEKASMVVVPYVPAYTVDTCKEIGCGSCPATTPAIPEETVSGSVTVVFPVGLFPSVSTMSSAMKTASGSGACQPPPY